MEFITLGCGSSAGVPMLACSCKVCTSSDPKNNRTRSSALIQGDNNERIAIDLSPDMRTQFLREKIAALSAVIITHCHNDHIAGLDDLRPFSFRLQSVIPIYARAADIEDLKKRYAYIFFPDPDYKGAPMPKISLHEIVPYQEFSIDSVRVFPFEVQHGNITSLGLRIADLAYIPDCSHVPDQSRQYLQNLKYLIIDGLWKKDKTNAHFNLSKAIEFSKTIKPAQTFITHMSCDIDYEADSANLPEGVKLSYDGMKIRI